MGRKSGVTPDVDGVLSTRIAITAGASTTVHTGHGKLRAIWLSASNTYAIEIKRNDADWITIPAGSLPGSPIPFWDADYETSLKVVPNASETAAVLTVFYNPYNS